MDKKKFFRADIQVIAQANPEGAFIVPEKNTVYILTVDLQRRFRAFKDAVLKVLINLSEFMAN